MLSKFIGNGDKVDLQAGDRGADSHGNANRKVYESRIHRLVSEDTIELLMPMEGDKVVLLPAEKEYDFISCFGQIRRLSSQIGAKVVFFANEDTQRILKAMSRRKGK